MAPSDVHVQTAGVLEGGEMARDPGGSLRRPSANVSNGARSGGSRRRPMTVVGPADTVRGGSSPRVANRRQRGCRKAASFGAGNRPVIGCRVGTRVPVAPSPVPPAGLEVSEPATGETMACGSHHVEFALVARTIA